MNTNDPGREPEPTDAGLLKRLAAEIRASEIGVGSMESGNLAIDAVIIRGHEYLSGARPMPDTPAPDEVAQARIAVLAALSELLMDLVMAVNPWGKPDETFPMVNGRQWFDYRSDLARACIEHGHTAFLALERGNTSAEEIHAEFKRLWDGRKEECESLSAANTALTARIADLEAGLAALLDEYDDRKAQFGNDYLWKKHEDAERVDNARRLAGEGGGK